MTKCEERMVLLALVVALHAEVKGQSTGPDATGRTDQIQIQRLDKARDLRGTKPGAIEKTFSAISNVTHRLPIAIGIAGLGPGAGLTMDSDLQWISKNDRVVARLWGIGSVHRFYTVGSSLEIRSILQRDVSVVLEGSHAD